MSNNISFCGIIDKFRHSIPCNTILLPGITSGRNLAYFLPSPTSPSVLIRSPQKMIFLHWSVTAGPRVCPAMRRMFPETLQWRELIFLFPCSASSSITWRLFSRVPVYPMSPNTLSAVPKEKKFFNWQSFVQIYSIVLFCNTTLQRTHISKEIFH